MEPVAQTPPSNPMPPTETGYSGSHSPQPPPLATSPTPVQQPLRKNPVFAALLASFPGLGHVYDGLYLRGITFFLLVMSLMAVIGRTNNEVLGFAVAFVWFFNVIDAVRQATLINYGYAQDLGLTDLPAHPKSNQGGLVMGVLLFVIGLYAALEIYFDLDLDWMLDLWPVGLMIIGGWLTFGWYRDKQKAENDSTEL